MKSSRTSFRTLLLSVLLAFVLGGGLFAWWAHQPATLVSTPLDVTIKPNSSVASVGRQLHSGGVAMPPWAFSLLVRVTGKGGKLKAGGYRFEQGETPLVIVARIARGDVNQFVVTIIEGWEFSRMRAMVDTSPGLRHDTLGLTPEQLMQAIGATESHPEGLFFPDTYLFAKGSSDLDLYRRAYHVMQKRLREAWENRAADLPYRTPYEALIMASIVEKETGVAADRPLIASVFVNRLKQGMPLQTDPTVIYGLGERFDGNLRKRDLLADTPWNTYTRRHLPPTPIALPGVAALRAALQPAQSEALYFVARGDGSSVFSRTLNEHNHAVNQWQRGKKTGNQP